MTQKTYSVEGMSCGGCEQTVEEAIERINGVEQATADHGRSTVEVALEGDISSDEIILAVEDAGYDASE